MKAFIKLIYVCVFGFGLVFLNACEDTKVQSIDKGPSTFDVNVNIEADNLLLRAALKPTVVDLDWDAVSGAVDYQVTRELQEADSTEIIEFTNGATKFSFASTAGQTYFVTVAAIDSNNIIIKQSKVITVQTTEPDVFLKSDEGL